MDKVVIDTEVYKNFFLLTAKSLTTGNVRYYELSDRSELDFDGLRRIMSNYTTISFNGIAFDIPIISLALRGGSTEELKYLCDNLIGQKIKPWDIRDKAIKNWDHIDLIGLVKKGSSLKILGAIMGAKKLQDLPIEPSALLTHDDMDVIRSYCLNDVETTQLLYEKLNNAVSLRERMSDLYKVDLRSKTDAQIAETILKHRLFKMTGIDYKKPDARKIKDFVRYEDPKIITFQSEELNRIKDSLIKTEFRLDDTYSLVAPAFLKNLKITIGATTYTIGLGGLHSNEKGKSYRETDTKRLFELDGESFYPSIMLQQKIFPDSVGEAFLTVLAEILKERLHAKHNSKDPALKEVAEILKIAINGLFGKLGSDLSFLFSPNLLLQTTITGQLSTLMLIEMLENKGVNVVSANTDGIVVYCDVDKMDTVYEIMFEWMMRTSVKLDKTDYKVISSRDVNNYLAIKKNGDIKRKGCFAIGGLSKNLDRNIIYTAITEFVNNGVPIDKTIKECKDINQFFIAKKLSHGAEFNGVKLGKAIRYYFSNDTTENRVINAFDSNGNIRGKVSLSDNAKPLMNLPDSLPKDIDYNRYITDSYSVLKGVGYLND